MASALQAPRRSVVILALLALLAGLVSVVQATVTPVPASAALPAGVTVTKVGWDVVGLDSNRVNVGPNQYPNGVRVCNTNVSGSAITGSATWTWANATNAANIYLGDDSAALSNSVNWSVAPNACQSVYWTVEVARATSSYFLSRSFSISVTSGGLTETNIGGAGRYIYVEKLVSQNRNIVGSVTGPGISPDTTPVYVGGEYTYTVTGATAPGGYEQLEFAAVFDPRFFEILEVSQNYGANSAPLSRVPNPNYQVYADGCGWNYTTRACTSTGKVGGNMTSTYKVRVIGSGTARLNTLIYDFSGSSYHYNADFGAGPSLTTATKALSVTKTSSASTYAGSGTAITFTIAFTNTGNTPITNLTVDDTTTRLGYAATGTRLASSACTPNLSGLSLAAGASVSCTYSYSTTANDVSAGSFTNTATVTGSAGGTPVSESGSVSLLYQETATKITVTKTATPSTFTSDDTRIYYTITVKSDNNGAGSVTITDPLIDGWITAGCPTGISAGGGVLNTTGVVCVGYHTITAQDRTRGYVTNTATAVVRQNGKDSAGTGTTRTDYAGLAASMSMTKTASSPTYGDDSTLTYTFVVANTGDDTITGLTIDDTQLNAPAVCGKTTLIGGRTPDDTTTCTGYKTFTLAEVNAGSVTNYATAKGFNSRNAIITANASATVNAPTAAPALTISKATSSAFFTGAGDIVPFNFVVTNTGNVTVNGITVSDDTITSPPGVTCQTRSLVPGASTTCVGRYTATAADEARGSIPNRASVTGTPSRGTPPTATSQIITIPYAYSEITATKVARDDTVAGVGSSTTFDIRIINTGNLNLTGVTVDDTIYRSIGVDSNVPVTCTRSLPTSLNVDDSFTCTASYTFTQADVDQGYVDNTVLALGDDTTAAIVDDSAVARVLGPARSPGLSIEKIALTDTFSAVDDTVNYQYRLRNTGNVTLTNVYVDDSKVTPQPIPCVSRTLAPGQSTTCDAYYLIRASDLNVQWLENTATATATPPSGTVLPPVTPSSAYVLKTDPPALRLTKTVNDDTFASAGQVRTYYVTAWNDPAGSQGTLTDLTISDPLFDDTVPPISPFGTLSCFSDSGYSTPTDDTTLTAGEYIYCRGNYTVTQADVNAGYVNNTATAIALTSQGLTRIARDTVTITGPTNVTTGITVTKSTPTTQYSTVGQVVPFNFLVKNIGQVTLTDVEVLDGTLTSGPTCPNPATLAPDDTFICTGTYTISAADLSQGRIVNVATATGVPTRGTQPTASPSTAIVPRAVVPNMTVDKTQTATTYTASGQLLSYSVAVTNTGDDTLNSVTLDDTITRTGGSPIAGTILSCTPTSLPGTLTPGQTTTCSVRYTTTTGESVNGGSVTNTATVRSAPASGGSLTRDDSVTATFVGAANPNMTVAKSQTASTYSGSGQTLTYSILVTNTGDDTLNAVTLDDTVTRTSSSATPGTLGSCSPIALPGTLNPGQSTTCGATYVTTAGESTTGGSVTNTATVRSTPASGGTLTRDDSVIATYASPTPNMTVVKSQTASTYSGSGQTLTYSILVTNTGDDTLNTVTLDDTVTRTSSSATPGTLGSCSPVALPGTLNPGQSTTCGATYVTTAGESTTGGSVTNTATVRATPASGGTLTRDDSVTATYSSTPPPPPPPPPAGSIGVTKSASPTTFTKAGDRITYTVVATNTGQAALTNVTVSDPKATLTCTPTTPASLAVGASITCTGGYTITQADVDAGRVDNTATATGTPPGGTPITGSGTTRVTGNPTSDLTVAKSASPSTFTRAGDRIIYTVVATNSGDVTLTGVTVTDPKVTLTCSPTTPATLAPGAKVTCTGNYTITQADVDAGSVSNTASASGKDPSGRDITGSDTKRITTPSEGKISVAKSASPAKFGKVGDRITYAVVATNSGEVTLTGVTVTDPKVTLTCSPATPATLAPGARVTCTGTYAVTQDDVDAGYVDNTATARGTDPVGRPTEGTGTKTVPGVPTPGLEVTKSASPTTFAKVGDSLRFTVVATNTGTATLTGVTVTDPKAPLTCSPATPARLAPGAKVTCSGTYAVTQDDVDAGKVSNTATASGKDPSGKDVTGRGTTEVPGPAREPSLHIAKNATPTTFGALGDRVTFTVVATNNGNVTLTGVTVTDPLVDLRCAPTTPATMAPGATVTCTGIYRVTQADVDRGAITNTAVGRGTDPGGNQVIGTGSTQVPALAPSPRLEFTKSASPTTATSVGQVVTYSFTVTNAGDVTIRSLSISDPMLASGPTCQATSLAPGTSTSCSGTYVVTQADIDRGSITNVATATGTPARGTLTPVTATVTIRAEKAWVKADERVTRQGRFTEVAVDNIRESPNLTPPRVTVSCVPTGPAPRGDFSYCNWRQTPRGIVVTTTGRPVKVTVTIRAQLKSDPTVWVTKKYVIRTRS